MRYPWEGTAVEMSPNVGRAGRKTGTIDHKAASDNRRHKKLLLPLLWTVTVRPVEQ